MTNISKEKRDRLLGFLDNLEETLDISDQHVDYIKELKNELIKKKYGLLWEEHSEEVDELLETKIPVFEYDNEKSIRGNNGTTNFIIEGDNYHSLQLLEKTHKNDIDMIYIDPPYNTHNSLTYDDKRVGDEDDFRHSLWLSFMHRRLKIAQKLLNDKGLIFISIDDNEGYNLKNLCDEIFGESNFMGSFSVTKAEGGGQAKYIIKGHDLVLIYAKFLPNTLPLAKPKDIRGKTFEKYGEQYWIQEDAYRKTFGAYGNLYYEEILDYKDKNFKEEIDRLITTGEVKLLKKLIKNDEVELERHIIGKVRKVSDDYSKYHSVIKELNKEGKTELASMGLEHLFDYPKPVNLIKELISGGAFLRKGDLKVLDFFAGSGTTGQAVLELTRELDREISFILCTNNEISAHQKLAFVKSKGYLETYKPSKQITDNVIEKKINTELKNNNINFEQLIQECPEEYESYGICQSVTYPRVKNIIEGYEFINKGTKVLKRYKLTPNKLDQVESWNNEMKSITQENNYEDYDVKIDPNNNITLSGKYNESGMYLGVEANLIYLRTSFIDKYSSQEAEDYYISDQLLSHITPLIELENMIDSSTANYKIIFNESDLIGIEEKINSIKTIYLSADIFLSAKLEKLISDNNVSIRRIPEYYYKEELQEAGEL